MEQFTDSLSKDLTTLEKLYRNSNNTKEKFMILKSIRECASTLADAKLKITKKKEVLFFDDLNNISTDISTEELMHFIYSIPTYKMYYDDVKKFKHIIDREHINYNLDDVSPSLDLTKSDYKFLTDLFYKNFGGYIYEYAHEFLKSDNIVYTDFYNSYYGSHFSVAPLNKNYITVGSNGNSEQILETMIHEVGHCVDFYKNKDREADKINFIEITSIFFEILADQFFSKYFDSKYFKKLESLKLMAYYGEAKDISFLTDIYSKLLINLDRNPYDFFNKEADKNNYEGIANVDEEMKYLYSYMIALELTQMYKENKKDALNILEKIIMSKDYIEEYDILKMNVSTNKRLHKYLKYMNGENNVDK